MMRTLRQNTKWIMLVTALAFVALMVFEWGMDLTGRSSSGLTGGEVGRVNGRGITYEEYVTAFNNLRDQQQAAYGNAPMSNAMIRQIEDAAFDQVVMEKLVEGELERRGLEASPREIRELALTMPPQQFMYFEQFQTDGQFDITKYHAFLSSPTTNPEHLVDLEKYYRDVIPRQKLYFQTTAGTWTGDDELWRMWRDRHDSVSVRFIALDPARLVNDAAITVSAAEIAAYYEQNVEDFIRPARAHVRYVHLSNQPNAADSAAAHEGVSAIRDEIAGGVDFGEVARRESADSASAAQGGAMTITRGQTVTPFEEAAFSQRVGQLGAPVLTNFGYHLIRVDSREGDQVELHHILIPIELTPEHEDELLTRVDSMDILAETVSLDSIASTFGIEVKQAEIVPGLTLVPGIVQAEDGELWAFEDAEPGDVSSVFENPTQFYAFELVERQQERTLSLPEATETIRAALLSRKRVAQAKDRAREAVDRLRSGQTLDQVAGAFGAQVQDAGPFTRGDFVPGLGRLNAAIGTAFGLKPGETSSAIEADGMVYILAVTERKDADRAAWEQQKDMQRQSVMAALAEQRWQQYLDALKASARIVDNRDLLTQPAAPAGI